MNHSEYCKSLNSNIIGCNQIYVLPIYKGIYSTSTPCVLHHKTINILARPKNQFEWNFPYCKLFDNCTYKMQLAIKPSEGLAYFLLYFKSRNATNTCCEK